MFKVISGGVNISNLIRPCLVALVLLVTFWCDGHATPNRGSIPQLAAASSSFAAATDKKDDALLKDKKRIALEATKRTSLFHYLKKAGAPQKSVAFTGLVVEAVTQDAPKIYRRGCFVKYFYRSIQPQAP